MGGGSPWAISTQPQGLIRGANGGELERDAVELAGGKGQKSQVSLDGRHRPPPRECRIPKRTSRDGSAGSSRYITGRRPAVGAGWEPFLRTPTPLH